MNKLKFTCIAIAMLSFTAVQAGGILTNTNQNIAFNRMMARDAAIGIDGVYSNPAGVIFLNPGLHLSFNWQVAHQTRTILTTNPDFALGMNNDGKTTKKFKGVADAPCIPSIQAAYNTGKWSFQGSFAVTGGGGKCEFDKGIGSFESAVGAIAGMLKPLGSTGYDVDGYMRGRQYYFGFTVGAAYKLTENLSVYGGVRLLYGTASYKAQLNNIRVNTANGAVPFGAFLDNANATISGGLQTLEIYREGVNLMSDQSGFGIAPIMGIDYKVGNFNFAAKYEFKTRIRMKNSSTVKEAHAIDAVNKYRDGSSVPEDQPALWTAGVQWSITPSVRIGAGCHLFFDKSAHWYNHEEKKLDKNTWEFNGGAEWDITDKLQVSGGFQKTNYGLSDEYMNDMSFVVSSYTYGFGVGYKISDKVKVNLAYFQTNYDTYKQDVKPTPANSTTHNDYTRTNRVFGVGVDLTL